jgi:sortase (surface protein transpeptidase)
MYYTIKPVQAQQQSFGGGKPAYQKDPETEKRIARMSVLKVAGDLVVNGVVKMHDLTKVASFLEQYVMTGQDTMTTIYSHAQPKAQEENNDLPF